MQRSYRLEAKRRIALTAGIREAGQRHAPLELIVRTAEKEKLASELERVGRVRHVYRFIPYISFLCDAADAEAMRSSAYSNSSAPAYRSIVKLVKAVDVANTVTLPPPRISAAVKEGVWNLEKIGAYEAQNISDGIGSAVAVIDTGVNYSHSEVQHAFGTAKGHDFVNNGLPLDDNGHGTHVAGIIAGRAYGVAPGAQLYSLKVLNAKGSGSEADSIAAVEWAVQQHADVINMSLGSPVASRAFEEVCYYAAEQGILLAAAAGNDGTGPSYPAAFDEAVIAVAAVDTENRHPAFSNVYETNDISAPGVDITSSYLDGYATLTGTSMASPHVAGALAIAASLAKSGIVSVLRETALPLGSEEVFGAGLLRAGRMAAALASGEGHARARTLLHRVMSVVW